MTTSSSDGGEHKPPIVVSGIVVIPEFLEADIEQLNLPSMLVQVGEHYYIGKHDWPNGYRRVQLQPKLIADITAAGRHSLNVTVGEPVSLIINGDPSNVIINAIEGCRGNWSDMSSLRLQNYTLVPTVETIVVDVQSESVDISAFQ